MTAQGLTVDGGGKVPPPSVRLLTVSLVGV